MPLQPIKSMQEYKRIKEELRNRFDSERSGDQVFQREQTKAFEPLINIQKETSKSLKDSIVSNQEARNNELVPLVQEMQRRNDQIDMLVSQPFYQAQIEPPDPIAESTPRKEPDQYDFDQGLNDTDRENLEDMGFDLPSVVFAANTHTQVLDLIKKENASLGQYLSEVTKAGKKTSEKEKEMYKLRKDTLDKYRTILTDTKAGHRYKVKSSKSGQGMCNSVKNKKSKFGVDLIICSSTEELCQELQRYCAAKAAGNTGVDNHINAILDRLLKEKRVDMDEYNNLYKNIFQK